MKLININEILKQDLSVEEWKIILQDEEIIESTKIKSSNIDFLKVFETIYNSYEHMERSHIIAQKCNPIKYKSEKGADLPISNLFISLSNSIRLKYNKFNFCYVDDIFKDNPIRYADGHYFATIPKQGNGRYYWRLLPNLEAALKDLKIISDEKDNENKLNGSHDKDIKDREHLVDNTVKTFIEVSKITPKNENTKNNLKNNSTDTQKGLEQLNEILKTAEDFDNQEDDNNDRKFFTQLLREQNYVVHYIFKKEDYYRGLVLRKTKNNGFDFYFDLNDLNENDINNPWPIIRKINIEKSVAYIVIAWIWKNKNHKFSPPISELNLLEAVKKILKSEFDSLEKRPNQYVKNKKYIEDSLFNLSLEDLEGVVKQANRLEEKFGKTHPPLLEAINSFNITNLDEEKNLEINQLLNEPEQEELYIGIEGEKKYVPILISKRDLKLRNECIKKKGLNCEICNFNFEKVYGELGKGFIHVHHINPLSGIEDSTENSIEDLIPICPNCHEMIHRHKKCLEVDELKNLIETVGRQSGNMIQ